MDNNQHLPPSAQMLQMSFGFAISRAISVAAQFRIADYLKDGPKTAVELAQLAGVHPRSPLSVAAALSGAAVFSEDSTGRFSLSNDRSYLRNCAEES